MTTPAQIMFDRRVRLLDLAAELGKVSAACRHLGVSRTRYYEWRRLAEQRGIDALWPKDRRRPAQPNETPTHVTADLLALAVVEPTLGCRQYADRLAELGLVVSKSTVHRILAAHQLSRRHQRVARTAAVAALSGLAVEPADDDSAEPFGFCHWAARPGDLVAIDSFYVGHLKGVGKVYLLRGWTPAPARRSPRSCSARPAPPTPSPSSTAAGASCAAWAARCCGVGR